MPNSFEKNLKVADLIKIRSEKRQKLASKKGRTSTDEFFIGQEVRVQDVVSKNWHKKGTIQESREADDGQETSFIIKMENGRLTTRHRCHIKPNVTRNSKVTDTKVRFSQESPQTEPQTESSAGVRTRSKTLGERELKSCLKPAHSL